MQSKLAKSDVLDGWHGVVGDDLTEITREWNYVCHDIYSMEASLRKKALRLGASEFGPSRAKGKKWMVKYKGKTISFGARGMSDYTIHKDPERRRRYRARHGAIRLKDGRLAYKVKTSPSFWSYNLLW